MSSTLPIQVDLALNKTRHRDSGNGGFPEVITNLPEAEVTCQGSKAWILQAESMQMVFFEFQEGGRVTDHSHSYSQWGMVIDGIMELTINGKPKMHGKGEEYLVPAGAIHSVKFPRKTRIVDLFCEKERYKAKKA
jgi:quercetin dioxygenase-like cupin family protein